VSLAVNWQFLQLGRKTEIAFVAEFAQDYNQGCGPEHDRERLVFDMLGATLETRITVRNGSLSDDIQSTIHQKVSKLPRFFDRTTAISVVADMRYEANPNVEIIVSAEESNDFVASDTGSNVLTALENAIQKIEVQLRKRKEKIKGHRGREHRHLDMRFNDAEQ
jgi:putative sigma-54 modulation protein